MRILGIITLGAMLASCSQGSSGAGDKLRVTYETQCDRIVNLDGFDERFQGGFCACWATELEKTLNASAMQQLITIHEGVNSEDEVESAYDVLEKTQPALGGAYEESADFCRVTADR